MTENQRRTFRCLRCNFVWFRYVTESDPEPKTCPKCNSPAWNKSKGTVAGDGKK
jgi:hypothetical protein